ncbi:hypothetical protein [Bdellovibrio sp. HCB274]|uniref:hypothetical protein n=1 Tax=Bdellovibrio sp. HCB274 TaxID=3394361 RepID=UPI0039B5BFB0
MRNVFALFVFFASSAGFAQESCLQAVQKNQTRINVCDYSTSAWVDCYRLASVCYTGSAEGIISKINSRHFDSGDNGLMEAVLGKNGKVHFTTWDVGTSCDLVAQPCE